MVDQGGEGLDVFRARDSEDLLPPNDMGVTLVKRGVPGSLRPLVAELSLPRGKHSQGGARAVAWSVAQGSYETAVADIRRTTASTMGKRQTEKLAVSLG